ncbi:glycosyltransferase family 4 protein [Hymenobacter busanensis]|uniref:Glycosyltransferase family 4 protein n=1 Tax=Hymenobacter busanensis TaxID=2607656 RepID=A0A7L4ZUW6_9BACT|nr:glycosyltransferase family 1 protein [Hymenobacter busanensis]KAA9339260.1 glycosyltransferase family 4 protein [Hymenobacter busanensis]QHJ06978.1 glycosyltransferase [Hymenobacter busanensis]
MKILYDHHAFSLQDVGGITRYFSELLRHAGSGTQCELPIVLSNNLYLHDRQHTRHVSIRPQWLAEKAWRLTGQINQWAAVRALQRGDFDVFHPTLNDADYFLDLIGDRPFVMTVHDLIPLLYPEYYPHASVAGLARQTARATRIIAVSENTRADLLRLLPVEPEQVVVVPHGTSPAVPSRTGLAVPEHYLLYTGTRRFYKNFDCLLQAFALLRPHHPQLYVVCAGGGPFSPAETAQLEQLGLADRVVQRGPLSEAQLAYLYAQAQAFVFPSHYEGFGIPILEAFAHGCPAVLSHASCFPEVAQEAALYFNPNSPAHLAEQLGRLLAEPALQRQLREAGHRRGHDFTWARTAALTHRVYQEAREVRVPA